MTDISDANSECWQLLQYQVGQFYAEHHDYIPLHLERTHGVRIITVFLYLSDVEEGGGTHFNTLGITVPPKRGRVVIWPSVLDDDPNVKDPRTLCQSRKASNMEPTPGFINETIRNPFPEDVPLKRSIRHQYRSLGRELYVFKKDGRNVK
ncbi:2-oxyglutarate/Fe(II) oxygenase [Nitzschia inconspicua]|uniref:2-oxyglutarate/Fe(II) oxygenase n=1 Tax=Nitzschia inconspicua TaxID=303405 RepID=A0A9K3KFZ4_9STRA|nr:2-oxyglutarate/Fe(II) oxygenase [Nitzschia inconspicua]